MDTDPLPVTNYGVFFCVKHIFDISYLFFCLEVFKSEALTTIIFQIVISCDLQHVMIYRISQRISTYMYGTSCEKFHQMNPSRIYKISKSCPRYIDQLMKQRKYLVVFESKHSSLPKQGRMYMCSVKFTSWFWS